METLEEEREVTVVLPFADDERTLPEAVRSIFCQTHQAWKLLLINDGSRDASHELAGAIDDPRVSVIGSRSRLGLPRRLNEGISATASPFLARMDADDVMHPERLARQLAAATGEPGFDIVGTRAIAIDAAGKAYGAYREDELPDDSRGYLRNGVFTHPTIFGRTSWFRRHLYDESLLKSQDKDLWCRTQSTSRFVKLPEFLLFYRLAGTTTLAKALATCRFDRRVVRRWGPGLAGRLPTAQLVAQSYAKQAAHVVAHATGRHVLLEGRRVTSLPSERLRAANDLLESIRETPVPGW